MEAWQSAGIAEKLKQTFVTSSEKLQKAAFVVFPVPQFVFFSIGSRCFAFSL
jgi:hypothetical protein